MPGREFSCYRNKPDLSCSLLFLTFPTEMRPGNCFQSCLGNRLLALLTNAESASADACQCFLDRSQKICIRFMYLNVKLRFRVGIGLIHQIPLPATSARDQGASSSGRGYFIQFGEQKLFVAD